MRVLVIPDVHLKAWLFDRAQDVLKTGKADRAVCLMDLPDDWNMEYQVELYKKTYDRAIRFAKTFPDTLWCYGNHDISYPWGRLESGYSPYAESAVITKLQELEYALPDPGQIAFVQRIDHVLFAHGGLTQGFVRRLNKELPDAGIDDVLAAVNHASEDALWDNASPLWHRPQYGVAKSFRSDTYTQVVGHTPVKEIYERNGFISTDVFSTFHNGKQIGESAMIVIDSETREYEKISMH